MQSTISMQYTKKDLSLYTTTGIGPIVDYFFLPKTKEELLEAIEFIRDSNLEYYLLGGGSNTIIDQNMDSNKAVICLLDYRGITPLEDFNILVRAGTVLQDVVDYGRDNELNGLTGLNRVPGTIGGAIVGNAGAYGCEISGYRVEDEYVQTVVAVTCLDISDLTFKTFSYEGCDFSYRDTHFKKNLNLIVLDITLRLTKPDDYTTELAEYNRISEVRDRVYPKGFKSPGSVFMNWPVQAVPVDVMVNIPESWIHHGKLPVGKLLEEVGSKGYNVNGFRMRETHGNIGEIFGPATYQDVEQCLTILKARVKDKFGLTIEPEIRLIKEFRKLK
jgi:UDP-N-acetylmuramate dehydrogenase